MPTHEATSVESDNAAAAMKETQRNIWTSGDYAAVANLTDSTQRKHSGPRGWLTVLAGWRAGTG